MYSCKELGFYKLICRKTHTQMKHILSNCTIRDQRASFGELGVTHKSSTSNLNAQTPSSLIPSESLGVHF